LVLAYYLGYVLGLGLYELLFIIDVITVIMFYRAMVMTTEGNV